jgi:hypothetical protein
MYRKGAMDAKGSLSPLKKRLCVLKGRDDYLSHSTFGRSPGRNNGWVSWISLAVEAQFGLISI